MDVREALAVIEGLDTRPVEAPKERNWPVSMIEAAAIAAQTDEGGRMLDQTMYDRMTEALSVLTGIPYTKMLSPEEIVAATPPLPRSLETQGEKP